MDITWCCREDPILGSGSVLFTAVHFNEFKYHIRRFLVVSHPTFAPTAEVRSEQKERFCRCCAYVETRTERGWTKWSGRFRLTVALRLAVSSMLLSLEPLKPLLRSLGCASIMLSSKLAPEMMSPVASSATAQETETDAGPISVVVFNLGAQIGTRSLAATSLKQFELGWQMACLGLFRAAKAAMPAMVKNGMLVLPVMWL